MRKPLAQTDVRELALLAFSAAQTKNPGVAVIVLAGLANARDREVTRLVLRAFRDGQRAAWLPPVEWETLLALPLDEVRRRLRVPAAPTYASVRASEWRETREIRTAA